MHKSLKIIVIVGVILLLIQGGIMLTLKPGGNTPSSNIHVIVEPGINIKYLILRNNSGAFAFAQHDMDHFSWPTVANSISILYAVLPDDDIVAFEKVFSSDADSVSTYYLRLISGPQSHPQFELYSRDSGEEAIAYKMSGTAPDRYALKSIQRVIVENKDDFGQPPGPM